MITSSSSARGFTLIEVLVALALMSLIGTILVESVRVGGHSWQHVTREASNIQEISRAQEFLRHRLESIQPISRARGTTATDTQLFVGETDILEFSGAGAGHSDDGLLRYWIGLSGSEPANLEVHYQRGRTEASFDPLGPGWTREVLIANVTGLTIQFWEQSAATSGHWIDQWNNQTKLPGLIRVDVNFANTDARHWPPLYVEPRIDTSTSCVFDVVSRLCRDGI